MNTWATWTTQGILSGHGGVRTVEIGVITGDLTVHTMWIEGEARLTVQYSGALDWFTVEGSPWPPRTRRRRARCTSTWSRP